MATLGSADDSATANGAVVLNYGQAVEEALAWSPDQDREPGGHGGGSVREAVEQYLDWYRVHRKAHDQVRNVFEAHVLPELGDLRIDALTPRRLRRWHQALAEKPARLRGGQLRQARTDDEKRARQVTANHALTALKAALNRAADEAPGDAPRPWSKVKAFRGVDAARVRYLEPAEIERLLNVCQPDLRNLVVAGVYTGARYGEIARLTVADYLAEASTLHIRTTKSDHPRHVYLSDEGTAFFESLTAGRQADAIVFMKADGSPWGRNHQARPMREACETASIDPPVGFHQLRHTYASVYLMSGGSLVSLAKQLGHTTTRMVEKHYGHLADSWRAEEARKHAPKLRKAGSPKVVRLRLARSNSGG